MKRKLIVFLNNVEAIGKRKYPDGEKIVLFMVSGDYHYIETFEEILFVTPNGMSHSEFSQIKEAYSKLEEYDYDKN